jgi:hypothetical protein
MKIIPAWFRLAFMTSPKTLPIHEAEEALPQAPDGCHFHVWQEHASETPEACLLRVVLMDKENQRLVPNSSLTTFWLGSMTADYMRSQLIEMMKRQLMMYEVSQRAQELKAMAGSFTGSYPPKEL